MKRVLMTVSAVLLCVGMWQLAGAGAIPWTVIQGAEQLSERQKTMVAEVLTTYNCYAGCSDTIAQCLVEKPVGNTAKRLAAFAVRRVLAGKNAKEINDDLLRRERSAFPPKAYTIKAGDSKVSGAAHGPVVVYVYADFQCPYCMIAMPAMRKLINEMPGKIALYYKNFPVKSHKMGVPLATALVAADNQGKYWEMLDLLYSKAPHQTEDMVKDMAKSLGLDMAKFAADRKAKATMDRIRAEKMEGIKMGMKGTPGIFINGKYYAGLKTHDELRDRIEEELDIINGTE